MFPLTETIPQHRNPRLRLLQTHRKGVLIMTDSRSSYRQILKSTSIFGGVQLFNILISILKSKILALLVGPTGIGIISLFTSTTGFVGGLTNFGLGISGVKDISIANEQGDISKISKVITVLGRWALITGLLGTVIVMALSGWLSRVTFENNQYTLGFILVSATLLFTQLNVSQLAVLQGMRKLQWLAKANIIGSLLGLVVSVPLYYLYGKDAIVPVIVLSAFISLLLSWFFTKKIKVHKLPVSRQETWSIGKGMLLMGFLMSLSNLMVLGASYITRLFIQNEGGLVEVGLYSAGFMIITTYTGLIFNAMSADYFPRLSSVANSNEESKKAINQQAEVATLVLAPILLFFLIFVELVILLLYSNQFMAIREMMHWMVIGIFFKAASWAVSLILVAKGASRHFFWSELIANIYMLALNLAGFKLWGLTGLGVSFMAGYIIYLVQVYSIVKSKYAFRFDTEFYKIFGLNLALILTGFALVKVLPPVYAYGIGFILICLSIWYSFIQLDKRMGIMAMIRKK